VREEVLDIATQLFWEKGMADTSLSDLENATGVNKSGLYAEFESKDNLYFECIKRYRATHPSFQILNTAPLGWNNIEKMFRANLTCTGKKGCFLSNSMREFAIIPTNAKNLIAENAQIMLELLEKNLKAAGVKKNAKAQAKLIMTFSAGIALKLNAAKPEELQDEIVAFLQLLKTSS
jgi:AcrR family transcriptional regulator